MSDLLTLRDVHHGYAQGAGILEVLRGINLSVKGSASRCVGRRDRASRRC